MWVGHNCWISFCHFFDIVNLVIFHPDCIDSGYHNNSIYWDTVCIGTPSILKQEMLQYVTNAPESPL